VKAGQAGLVQQRAVDAGEQQRALATSIVKATHVVVSDPPGDPTTLTIYNETSALAIHLGPSECVALASDLLLAARIRYGRPTAGESSQ
jgi:hypothetical protein